MYVESIGFHWVSVWLYRPKLPENSMVFFRLAAVFVSQTKANREKQREAEKRKQQKALAKVGGGSILRLQVCRGLEAPQATPKSKLWMTMT